MENLKRVQPKEIIREYTKREITFMGYLDNMIRFRSEMESSVPAYAEQHKHYKEAYKMAKALMTYMHNLHDDPSKLVPSVLEAYLLTLTPQV